MYFADESTDGLNEGHCGSCLFTLALKVNFPALLKGSVCVAKRDDESPLGAFAADLQVHELIDGFEEAVFGFTLDATSMAGACLTGSKASSPKCVSSKAADLKLNCSIWSINASTWQACTAGDSVVVSDISLL